MSASFCSGETRTCHRDAVKIKLQLAVKNALAKRSHIIP